MIDITSFILKHLYELMADNYNATPPPPPMSQHSHTVHHEQQPDQQQQQQQRQSESKPDQETNQQIVSFVINNQLPDLACETLIELIFICVFLAVSWIFVMILQLHCHQPPASNQIPLQFILDSNGSTQSLDTSYQRASYCDTKFLNSLVYRNYIYPSKQSSS